MTEETTEEIVGEVPVAPTTPEESDGDTVATDPVPVEPEVPTILVDMADICKDERALLTNVDNNVAELDDCKTAVKAAFVSLPEKFSGSDAAGNGEMTLPSVVLTTPGGTKTARFSVNDGDLVVTKDKLVTTVAADNGDFIAAGMFKGNF